MALNLNVNDCDRAVPNCSDESGSDCSSEELIDCDTIVDVITVTGTDVQHKIGTSPQKLNVESSLLVDDDAKSTKTEQKIIVNKSDNHCKTLNKKYTAIKELNIGHDGDKVIDKTLSIINRNSLGKHVNYTKSIGKMR